MLVGGAVVGDLLVGGGLVGDLLVGGALVVVGDGNATDGGRTSSVIEFAGYVALRLPLVTSRSSPRAMEVRVAGL